MKIKSLLSLSLAAALSVASLSGCAELMKGMGEAAANLTTEKTASISNVALKAQYITNLFPLETQETGLQYIGEAWQPGKNALVLVLYKQKGVGTYEIDGTIGYRNAGSKDAFKPVNKVLAGSYAAILEAGDTSPKEIQIETSTGQRLSFTATPAPPVKISKINGQASGANVDLSKDVVLELENPGNDVSSRLSVSLLTTVLGVKTFVDVGNFKPASKIVIPAAAFRHPAVSASSQGFVGFDPGPNYLRVERYQVRGSETLKERTIPAFQNIGASWSTVPVTVSGGARDQSKLEVRGEMPVAGKKFYYDAFVPNAFYGRPFSSGKNFAVASLQVDGSLLKTETFQGERYGLGYKIITTTTITKQFPQLPDGHWDQLMQTLHTDLAGWLKQKYGINMVPTEKVVKAASYAELEEPAEENSERFIKRSYKGSKHLMPASFTGALGAFSSTFASDRPLSRLMKETATDGLINLGLSLQVASDENGHIVLVPVLNYQVYGPPNGYVVGPTIYASGRVIGTGTPFSEKELSNSANLARVVQIKELMSGLQKALGELEAKEREAGYQSIWALQ